MIVGRRFAWSVHVFASTPFAATPGPTKPTHVLPISSWMSPWFQANPGETHGLPPNVGFEPAVKKKSGLPKSVNVGVRAGSALIMCRSRIATESASAEVIGVAAPLALYGSCSVIAPTSRSSLRTVASVRDGLPATYTVGASSECTANDGEPAGTSGGRVALTSPIWLPGHDVSVEQFACA